MQDTEAEFLREKICMLRFFSKFHDMENAYDRERQNYILVNQGN